MSEVETKRPEPMTRGQIILRWWSRNIGDRDMAHARGLSARLRRGSALDVLGEAAVHDLSRALNLRDATGLIRLVQVLAEVREHTGQPLAAVLGEIEMKKKSETKTHLRFRRLMRVDDDDLTDALRRAIAMANRRCNVAALGQDLLDWSEKTRSRWCFQYFGAAAPEALHRSADVREEEISQ